MKKAKGLAGTKCALEHSKTMYSTGGSMIKPKYQMGGESQMTDLGTLKRKIKKGFRKVKNAIKNPGGGSHTPTFHKPKCGGPGHYC